jgi:hypothetical protein
MINVDFYSDPNQVPIQEITAASGDDVLLLFDYDLGPGKLNGLELLAKFPLAAQKFLVTGHFDHADLRDQCERDGVFLIPKTQIDDLRVVVVD